MSIMGVAYHWPSKAVRRARDIDILRLHGSGECRKDIAAQLGIHYSTVTYTLKKEGVL